MATNRETLLKLRTEYVQVMAEANHPNAYMAAMERAVRLLDRELAAIPELVYDPSPDMDSGGSG